jgi:hypothetical protein
MDQKKLKEVQPIAKLIAPRSGWFHGCVYQPRSPGTLAEALAEVRAKMKAIETHYTGDCFLLNPPNESEGDVYIDGDVDIDEELRELAADLEKLIAALDPYYPCSADWIRKLAEGKIPKYRL